MTTIREMFEKTVSQFANEPAQIFFGENDQWITRTYAKLRDRAVAVAGILQNLGLEPAGNRVALILENRPEWQEIYLGMSSSGTVVIPIDPQLRLTEIAHILKDSEATIIIAAGKLKDLVLEAVRELSAPRHLIFVDKNEPAAQIDGRSIHSYESLVENGSRHLDKAMDWLRSRLPKPDDIASIIYTSGTTGTPKGAMLSHNNFCSAVDGTLKSIRIFQKDQFFTVLPLFHSYSFTANFMVPIAVGAAMSFVRNLKTVADDMKVLKPSLLFTVPLMAEKMYDKAMAKVNASLFAKCLLRVGLGRIIGRKIIAGLGGNLRLIGVGGAPCPLAVSRGFTRLGIPILEGYGLTECSPSVAYSDLGIWEPGTVGKVIPTMQWKLADANEQGVGELCVKGPNVMLGYYKRPEATAEIIDSDGYLHTGDLVSIDKKGLVRICGRRKALIVNREGKNIYPEEVEQMLEKSPYIKDVIVLGYQIDNETGERVGAIVTPNLDAIREALPQIKLDDTAIRAFLQKSVARLSDMLAEYKRPRKIEVRMDSLERTSTMKVKRGVYAGQLNESKKNKQ